MKHWLALAALICFGSPVAAQELTYQTISSGTYSGVTVSTSVATRVDFWNKGSSNTVLANRSEIVLGVPNAAASRLNCGFDSSVSTKPASGNLGVEYSSGPAVVIRLPTQMAYWCLAQATAAGVPISMQQVTPWKPGSRSIPGSP